MIVNAAMEGYLNQIKAEHIVSREEYPIWCQFNQVGQPFWGAGNFCGIATLFVDGDCNLTELEWIGNEVHIGCCDGILGTLIHGLGIVSAWKTQLETEYPYTAFDIMLSIDEGDEEVLPSITIRFWAIRNQEHYVNPSMQELEKFSQPVLMEQVNFVVEDFA